MRRTARASFDFRRAAVFRWMAPCEAALSSRREVSRKRDPAVSASPEDAASWTVRASVRRRDRVALFASRRRSFCRLRLIWDLMFATASQSSRVGSRPPDTMAG